MTNAQAMATSALTAISNNPLDPQVQTVVDHLFNNGVPDLGVTWGQSKIVRSYQHYELLVFQNILIPDM